MVGVGYQKILRVNVIANMVSGFIPAISHSAMISGERDLPQFGLSVQRVAPVTGVHGRLAGLGLTLLPETGTFDV